MEPQEREQLNLMSLQDLQTIIFQKLDDYQVKDSEDITTSLLHALFEFAPSDVGKRNVAVDIVSCLTDSCLRQLADRYWTGLILPIRAAGGKTPRISDHPSRQSADPDDSVNSVLLKSTKRDRRSMRVLVLHRENYRCIVSGDCDWGSVRNGKTNRQQGEGYHTVDTAHILPFSLVPSSDNTAVVEQSSMIWQVISAFSGISPKELNGDDINRPENGFALNCTLRDEFVRLGFCFEQTSTANTYKVLSWGIAKDLRLPDTISFVSRSGVPVPDPRYLALHTACAKVLHQTAMAEVLDRLLDDLEELPVLLGDGSSAHLLHHALETAAVRKV